MTPAIAGGITASIVLFTLTTGITAVAGLMLALFVFALVGFAVAPLYSSKWIGDQDAASTAARSDEPSDD
ncbi:hypothetical protein CP556_03630 [Natrinema sp. CBA1119]|uniref:hypothetical protein n=1 Tax=Natrinema sp. CBA1119 TaxID=1608465 RepID=UPI000BF465D1|nr:hypothetical protein [Natrinema sp. CBA1119]PGF15307.1 hypothetical protein CP556_03630 [Natrinema sp. CBA1119]